MRLLKRCTWVLLLCISTIAWGQSQKQQELEQQRQAILQDLKKIENFLFKTRGEKKSVLSQMEDLNRRISTTENLIRITNQQANLLTREINDNLQKIDALRKELEVLKEDYAAMIKKSYRSKSQQSRIMFLLSSENFLQAYKRLQYMKQYTKHRKAQGEEIKEKTALLQTLNNDLLAQKEQKKKLIDENRITKAQLTKEKKDQEALVASLKKDEGKYASQIREKQREAARIDREIDDLIKAAIAEANKKSGATTTESMAKASKSSFALTPEAKALASSFKNNKGKLSWPVEKGVVVNPYGTRRHPQFPNVEQTFNGVEIATEENAEARSVFKGEVMRIQQLKGANKAVYVRHGDYITLYSNLANVVVSQGDQIAAKQKLGTVFTHPTTRKTVLKFYVYQNTTRMNPADWIYRM
ncbi:MAG: peptidoglycan DD-metalloendopeptidase family protein [Flavobacteriaceae bacterium]|nr:peptidoglycan DD-metalloendopeptidase family protein [Flavobacteriaceae bacterium]